MVDEATLEVFRATLGYTDEQWEKWKSDARNLKLVETLMANFAENQKLRLVAEVTSSYGCGAQHKVGDRIVFANGVNLQCKESPDQICYGLLLPIIPYLAVFNERICNGEDPDKYIFPMLHCVDVGVDRGGWGEVIAKIKVEKIQD
jgi:uncharacterized repeat protein (TIGR04076 family)